MAQVIHVNIEKIVYVYIVRRQVIRSAALYSHNYGDVAKLDLVLEEV